MHKQHPLIQHAVVYLRLLALTDKALRRTHFAGFFTVKGEKGHALMQDALSVNMLANVVCT